MDQGDVKVKVCFLDKARRCPQDPGGRGGYCMAWDSVAEDCLALMQMRVAVFKNGATTLYPVSAPPPEVKG
jgi:hypothetical protein